MLVSPRPTSVFSFFFYATLFDEATLFFGVPARDRADPLLSTSYGNLSDFATSENVAPPHTPTPAFLHPPCVVYRDVFLCDLKPFLLIIDRA